ncbi:response regulator [Rhodoplanes roseus]|uniref:response regulator n=1 Tax=Rhodoplanes roseus TaxID=29409 RepID=UPI001FE22475|nr:response regulator [Rhodoplanes roseus]
MPACPPDTELPDAIVRKTVLVIDDDITHRAVICRVADRAGFAAIGAETVEDAELLLGSHQFDCVTLDISLGARSGYDVLKALAKLGFDKPVLIVSGLDVAACRDAAEAARRLALDAVDPLQKPIDPAALRVRLDAARRRPGHIAV